MSEPGSPLDPQTSEYIGSLESWNENLREALDTLRGIVDGWQHPTEDAPRTRTALRGFFDKLTLRELDPSPARTRALSLLAQRWREHMDDTSIQSFNFTAGLASMAWSLGLISDEEVSDYMRRIRQCPEGKGNHGDRVWCAYCGTLRTCAYCDAEIQPSSLSSVKKGAIWFCNLTCRGTYLRLQAADPNGIGAKRKEAVESGKYIIRQRCRVCHQPYELNAKDAPTELQRYGYCSDGCKEADHLRLRDAEMTR